MMTELTYLDYRKEDLIERPLWWHLKGLSYTASGYGGKIPTTHMIRHSGRLKRVYVMIWSNSGTAYVLDHGRRLILRES